MITEKANRLFLLRLGTLVFTGEFVNERFSSKLESLFYLAKYLSFWPSEWLPKVISLSNIPVLDLWKVAIGIYKVEKDEFC